MQYQVLKLNTYITLLFFVASPNYWVFYWKRYTIKKLSVFSVLGLITTLLLGLFTTGNVAIFSFLSGGLFYQLCGHIFSLSIKTAVIILHKDHPF